MTRVWRVIDILDWARQDLTSHGVERARLDAELLLGEALGLPRLQLYTNFDRPLTPEERDRYRALHRRRRDREPVAYILGHRGFYSLELSVTPDVLVPRPETEHLVEAALELLPDGEADVVDVGTGSGCIACALSHERPAWRLWATDLSAAALAVARSNAARTDTRVTFLEGDLLSPLPPELRPHAIVSNPPYVTTGELAGLAPELGYEPRQALDGGADGLDVYRRLVPAAGRRLRPDGWLVLEIGAAQGPGVTELLLSDGSFAPPVVRRDLAGHERVVVARRTADGCRP